MKNLNLFLILACSWTAQAQITAYSNSTIDNFKAIGGYAYFESNFQNVATQNPYTLSGPFPQYGFTFAVSSPLGLNGNGNIITQVPNQPITITFKSNNVRKMSCFVSTLSENIQITASSNLGNTSTIFSGMNGSSNFVGFNVQGENEYLSQVVFSAPSGTNINTLIDNILIGDNTPQNVALNFDGINDHIAAPISVGNFNANDSFTITCWVKAAASQVSLVNTDNAILEKWDGVAGAYPFVIRYINSGVNAGKILAQRYDGNIAHTTVLISGGSINDGKWHHVAYVRESNGGLKLYLDGAFSNGDPDFVQNTTTNSSPLYIGSRNNINHFKGEIDEVRIWSVEKTQTEIQNEMFCKNPDTNNLQAAFNFNNGSPNNDNSQIISVENSINFNSPGFLFGFNKNGDASNFVTGQVKYVKNDATGLNDGSSWANAFTNLQTALASTACNDLFDVYVAKGNAPYKPDVSNNNSSFDISSGMKIYGGFAGTEKNINERNLALVHSTNQTTLSGDLNSNDTPFNYSTNRGDNSLTVVSINGGYVILDGFTVRGGQNRGIFKQGFGDVIISNCRMVDNEIGLLLYLANSTVSNCTMAGNNTHGVYIATNSSNFSNCLIANNGGDGIFYENGSPSSSVQSNLINCTIASNGANGIESTTTNSPFSVINNNFKNTIIKDNAVGIVDNGGGTTNYIINYSLLQGGITLGTGNLDPNTNPQFVSPLANTVRSDAGDYHLNYSSPCFNTGTDVGVSPLDLDRNSRPQGGKTDMGAYEIIINPNEIISIANGNWESNSTWNLLRLPLATDKVIMNGHTVTVTTNAAKAKNIEQKPSSDLKFNTGGSLMLHQ